MVGKALAEQSPAALENRHNGSRLCSVIQVEGVAARRAKALTPCPRRKSQIRNPKQISNPKVEIQYDSPHPLPLSQNGRGEAAPSRPTPFPGHHVEHHVPMVMVEERGAKRHHDLPATKVGATTTRNRQALAPGLARLRLILAPLPTCGCVTPKNSKQCVFPLLHAIFPERYPGRWGNQYNH